MEGVRKKRIDSLDISSTYFLRVPAGDPHETEGVAIKEIAFENPASYILTRTAAEPPEPVREHPNWEAKTFRIISPYKPASVTCPRCFKDVTTEVRTELGSFAWLAYLTLCICGLGVGCLLIPIFSKSLKNYRHICPRCHKTLYIHTPCPLVRTLGRVSCSPSKSRHVLPSATLFYFP